jgi:HEAT repeat protein
MNKKKIFELFNKLKDKNLNYQERMTIRRQIISSSRKLEQELCEIIEKENDMSFKIELLEIIGATQDVFFEDAVKKVIDKEDRIEVLQTAATTLGKLKSENSFQILIKLLAHESPNVRLGAIYGLVALGEKTAVKYLLELLDDHEPAKCWWPSPKAGGYIVSKEASDAIDIISGENLQGNKEKIKKWISKNIK